MHKIWDIKKHDRAAATSLANELGIHPLTAALLISRGRDTAEKASRFLSPSVADLHDPSQL